MSRVCPRELSNPGQSEPGLILHDHLGGAQVDERRQRMGGMIDREIRIGKGNELRQGNKTRVAHGQIDPAERGDIGNQDGGTFPRFQRSGAGLGIDQPPA